MLTKTIKNKEQKLKSRSFKTQDIYMYFTNKYKRVSAYRSLGTKVNKIRGKVHQEEEKLHPSKLQKKFYDIKKEWSGLSAVQVLENLLRELGLVVPDSYDLERVFKEFSDFNIESDCGENSDKNQSCGFKTQKYERMKDVQKLAMINDYLQNRLTVVQLARKYFLKYSTVYSMIQKLRRADISSK